MVVLGARHAPKGRGGLAADHGRGGERSGPDGGSLVAPVRLLNQDRATALELRDYRLSRLSVGPGVGAQHPADIPRSYVEAGPGADPDGLRQVAVGEVAEEATPSDGNRRGTPVEEA
eukprot:8542467-Alexandrium_andersonii.AAC.1